jgi:uncharacterized membrane protein YdbT with pleckstrin-like domain
MFLGEQRFRGDEGEKIIKLIHRHWFNIFKHFALILAMVAIIVGIFFYLPALLPQAFQDRDMYALLLFIENTFMVFIWLYVFFIWIDYYFDIWIITDKRIVNIEQKGLFVRSVSELKYEKIQDVTTEVKGVIPTFLNYGDVFVQTAAEKERFVFRQVPDPNRIKNLIMNLQKDIEKEETDELGEMLKERIGGN